MPQLKITEAAEKLANVAEKAKPTILAEIYSELFPETPPLRPPVASDIARRIREGLEADELVDLWNVVFPQDRHVWYDEEEKAIHYNEEMAEYAD
jgi:hypothetical protein